MLLCVAPMDGVSDAVFRVITKKVFEEYGNKEDTLALWTEFMNVHGYQANPQYVIKHIVHTDYETPLIGQLYGADSQYLLKSFKEIEDKYGDGFDGLELNVGCPARKVVDSGCGAGMLHEREYTFEVIQNLAKELSLPFSIKTRTGLTQEDKEEQLKYLVEISPYVDKISVHGRTLAAGYAGDPDWDFIYKLKQLSDSSCTIIGNGGIKAYSDIPEYIGNLDGVMIGQASIGNPWVFTPHIPSVEEIYNVVLEHLQLLAQFEIYHKKNILSFEGDIFPFPLLEELEEIILDREYKHIYFTVIEFRKFLFNYVKGFEASKEFKMQVAQIKDYYQLVDAIKRYFEHAKYQQGFLS